MSAQSGTELMPWEQFDKLTKEEREAYVEKQVKSTGVTYLKLLETITEKNDPNYEKLVMLVSGQKPAGKSSKKGGTYRQYASRTRRKKNQS